MNYYNENDSHAAAWLRELIKAKLIPYGIVDERSITEVQPEELRGFTQCHFFAGVSGWSLALQLAGWPEHEPIWTGSCPCQPFSVAGKGQGEADERHLWPAWFNLIRQCRPQTIISEQVASAEVVGSQLEASFLVAVQAGQFARANKLAKQLARSKSFHYSKRWITGVRADLASSGYSMRAEILGAHSAGAPHIRQRLYWVAHLQRTRLEGHARDGDNGNQPRRDNPDMVGPVATGGGVDRLAQSRWDSTPCRPWPCQTGVSERPRTGSDCAEDCEWVGDPSRRGFGELRNASQQGNSGHINSSDKTCGMANTHQEHGDRTGLGPSHDSGEFQGSENLCGVNDPVRMGEPDSPWDDFQLITCADGKTRRIPSPESGIQPLAYGVPGRVALLRGPGNAIIAQVATQFIKAYLDIFPINSSPLMDLLTIKTEKHQITRAVSRGAEITLTAGCGGWQALFGCATLCRAVLGELGHFQEFEGGVLIYDIHTQHMHKACEKLSAHHSVALVDQVPTDGTLKTTWALVWRIEKKAVLVKKIITMEDF